MFSVFFIFFDYIASLLNLFLSPILQLCFWGAVAGGTSMFIYSKVSPQAVIANLTDQRRGFQKQIMNLDAEFDAFLKASIKSLGSSLSILKVIVVPTLLASLPALILAFWIHTRYSYEFIPVSSVALAEAPKDTQISDFELIYDLDENVQAQLGSGEQYLQILFENQLIYSGDPFFPPYANLYKRKWWNFLFPNPAGYLRSHAPTESLILNFPARTFLDKAPKWAASWELPFFACAFIFAFLIKLFFKIK